MHYRVSQGVENLPLINNTLYHSLAKHLYKSNLEIGPHKEIIGFDFFDKVVDVNQSPIGRTPRSNPATYTGLFTPIRDIFSKVPESKLRGYAPGRFSFNVKGGGVSRVRETVS